MLFNDKTKFNTRILQIVLLKKNEKYYIYVYISFLFIGDLVIQFY